MDFAVLADHRIKLKEREMKDKYFDLACELKKLSNMKVTIIPIGIGAFGTVTKGLLKWLEDLKVEGRVEAINENGQNTEESPEDLGRLAVTQTPVKDHYLTLMWKTLRVNNNNNNTLRFVAQSTWAEEYTNYISAGRKTQPHTECPWYYI